mmetsp:Transcript_53329/g.126072  ORF Transcript_53329/g.126072 Transcript_53329/m.126072 type:complete len:333 (-) Transcript_53329:410-1408(-)
MYMLYATLLWMVVAVLPISMSLAVIVTSRVVTPLPIVTPAATTKLPSPVLSASQLRVIARSVRSGVMSFSIVIPRCASSSRFAVPAYAIPPVAARSVILPPAVSILPVAGVDRTSEPPSPSRRRSPLLDPPEASTVTSTVTPLLASTISAQATDTAPPRITICSLFVPENPAAWAVRYRVEEMLVSADARPLTTTCDPDPSPDNRTLLARRSCSSAAEMHTKPAPAHSLEPPLSLQAGSDPPTVASLPITHTFPPSALLPSTRNPSGPMSIRAEILSASVLKLEFPADKERVVAAEVKAPPSVGTAATEMVPLTLMLTSDPARSDWRVSTET